MEEKDISDVLQIWLETNIKAHSFIDKEYWTGNYEMVKQILPDRKSTRLNSSHPLSSRMPSSA